MHIGLIITLSKYKYAHKQTNAHKLPLLSGTKY